MEELKTCPVCGNQTFTPFLSGKDYFLTGEEFMIVQCSSCNFRFTNPRPAIQEISRYYDSENYISHESAGKTLFRELYRKVREFTIRDKYLIVKKNSTGNVLLDIGCGTGEFLNFCKKKCYETTGIEPNLKARNFARKKYSLNILDETHIESLNHHHFHVITMWHVLEHVHNLNERIKKIQELLTPTGSVIIALPDCESWDAKFYKSYWAAYDLPRHLYHFTPVSINKLLQNHGFSIVKIIPLKFDAFYISLLSEKYLSGRQNFIKAFYYGLRSNYFAKKNELNYSSLIYICKISQELK